MSRPDNASVEKVPTATQRNHVRLAPRSRFLSRIAWSGALAFGLIVLTLGVGVVGYHEVAGLPWIAAFHQSSLLLSGMGPAELGLSDAGRLFESVYALFCGVILVGAAGILFAPLIHRLLHRFHLEDARR